jgi:phosphodiesterase/alkaline phosphatase D-like protein
VLSAAINPGYGLTVYRFDYGADTGYDSRTSLHGPLGEDGVSHPVQIVVTGLAPGTTYHYRAVATNFSGAVKGPDQAFTTPGPPDVGTIVASQVSTRTAHVETTINPVLAPTTYRVEYGSSGSTGELSLGPVDNAPHAVSVDLTGLSPGTRYQVRVVATNANGVDVSDYQSFTTGNEASTSNPSPPCKKGRVKRQGHCVKKHSKRRHHRKHGNRASGQDGAKARS